MYYKKKSDFELLFPIIISNGRNLFENDDAYFQLRNRFEWATLLLKETDEDSAYLVDFYRNRFSIIAKENIETILSDAKWLLNYLKKGKRISVHTFLQFLMSSRQLRKRLYVAQSIFMDGHPCKTLEILEALILYCQLMLNISAIAEVWKVEVMDFGSTVEKYRFLEKLTEYAKETMLAYEKGVLAVDQLKAEAGLLL